MRPNKLLLVLAAVILSITIQAQSLSITVSQQTATIGDVVTATVIVQGGLQLTTLNWDDGQQTSFKLGSVNDTLVFYHKYTYPGIPTRIVTVANGQMQAADTITVNLPPPNVHLVIDAPDTVQAWEPVIIHYYVDNNTTAVLYWNSNVSPGIDTITAGNTYLAHNWALPAGGLWHPMLITNWGDTIVLNIVVTDPIELPLEILSPMSGAVLFEGSTDTIVVKSTLVGPLKFGLNFGFSTSYFSPQNPVWANDSIKKYVVTWPTGYGPANQLHCFIRQNQYFAINNGYQHTYVMLVDKAIQGRTYMDFDANNVFDGNDIPYNTTHVGATPAGQCSYTNQQGIYSVCNVPDTTVVLALNSTPLYYSAVPQQYTVDMTIDSLATGYDFALQPTTSVYDLDVDVVRYQTFVAQPSIVKIKVKNVGTIPSLPTTLNYAYDSTQIQMLLTDPICTGSFGNLQFTVPSLNPYQTTTFTLMGIITQPFGSIITEIATTPLSDADTTNNSDVNTFAANGSYDPNNIIPSPGIIYTPNNINPEPITYVINFQNTGNAPAVNIRVRDTIATNLDMGTFEVIESSHTMNTIIRPDGVVDFMFNNIMLPDSNANEAASHGYVVYSVKPTGTIPVNTTVDARAAIYFDYNPAVKTAKAHTTVLAPTGIAEHTAVQFTIYPNPANGILYIQLNTAIQNDKIMLCVFAADGRLVYTENFSRGNSLKSINTSALPAGIYSVQLTSGKKQSSQRLVVMK